LTFSSILLSRPFAVSLSICARLGRNNVVCGSKDSLIAAKILTVS